MSTPSRTLRLLRGPGVVALLLVLGATAATSSLEGLALAARHASGKPSVKPGEPPAAWLWFDDAGWHLRGSAGKSKHTFTAYLRVRGAMTGVKPSRAGLMQSFQLQPDGVQLEFQIGGAAAGAVEGVDWHQTGEECVTVELKIDGKQQPSRIFVGLRSESPELIPFLACRE